LALISSPCKWISETHNFALKFSTAKRITDLSAYTALSGIKFFGQFPLIRLIDNTVDGRYPWRVSLLFSGIRFSIYTGVVPGIAAKLITPRSSLYDS
jgi:hypothetical protein